MAKKRFKISASIDRLFLEKDLPERVAAAADAGFDGVELPLPYDFPAPELRDKAVFAGIPIVRIDAPPPNYTGGPQGYAALPETQERFRRDVVRVIRQVGVMGCSRLHLRSGLEGQTDVGVLIDNLRFAAKEAPKLTLLVELLNPQDYPDHCLATTSQACDVIREVDRDNIKLMFSSWHANRQPEGLAKSWETCAAQTGHVILGGGAAGEQDHRAQAMVGLVGLSEYSGWVCAEYTPDTTTQKSLSWLPK
ncbi:TIM barrel protein [Roseobacteraceae bacterium S113]